MEGQPRVRNEWRGSTRGVGVRTRQATAAGQRPGKRRANTSGADSRASEPPGLSQVVYRRATRSTVVLLRCHRRRYVVVVLVQWQRAVVLLRVDRQRSNIERIANKIPAKERNRPSTCLCRLFFSFFCFLSHTREKQEEVWGETQVDHIPEDTSLLKEFPLSLSLSLSSELFTVHPRHIVTRHFGWAPTIPSNTPTAQSRRCWRKSKCAQWFPATCAALGFLPFSPFSIRSCNKHGEKVPV